jgi:hypothetical protein
MKTGIFVTSALIGISSLALLSCGMPQAQNEASLTSISREANLADVTPFFARINSLNASTTAATASALIAEAQENILQQSVLTDVSEKETALEELRILQAIAYSKVSAIQNFEARNQILQLWNDFVENELILRRIYGESAAIKIQSATKSNDAPSVLAAAHELARFGNADFSGVLIDAAERFKTDRDTYTALLNILAKSANDSVGAGYLLKKFTESPTLESLKLLVRTGLPSYVSYKYAQTRKEGEPSAPIDKTPALRALLGSLVDFIRHTNPGQLKKIKAKKDAEIKEIRTQILAAVSLLAKTNPEALEMAQPLLSNNVASHDEQGFFYQTHGVTLREGDFVLYRFSPEAFTWEGLTKSSIRYSHIGAVTFSENGEPFIADEGYTKFDITPIHEALHKAIHVSFVRKTDLTNDDRARLHAAFWGLSKQNIPFDYRFNFGDEKAMYCAEAINSAFKRASVPVSNELFAFENKNTENYIREMGAVDKTLLTIAAVISSPDLAYVGTAYMNDADKLIQGRVAGEKLIELVGKSSHTDFGKLKGALPTSVMINIFRKFNVGGLGSMTPAFASNVRNLDAGLKDLSNRIVQRLQADAISIRDLDSFNKAAKRFADEEAPKAFKGAFTLTN